MPFSTSMTRLDSPFLSSVVSRPFIAETGFFVSLLISPSETANSASSETGMGAPRRARRSIAASTNVMGPAVYTRKSCPGGSGAVACGKRGTTACQRNRTAKLVT